MKIRIFSDMCDGVYRIVFNTEDWSQGDVELMAQFGEPEINVGGDVIDDGSSSSALYLGDEYVRILHGFPYSRGFDSRDMNGSAEEAIRKGNIWKGMVSDRIRDAVMELRSRRESLPTEEIENV